VRRDVRTAIRQYLLLVRTVDAWNGGMLAERGGKKLSIQLSSQWQYTSGDGLSAVLVYRPEHQAVYIYI
jgi:hypothetical protein